MRNFGYLVLAVLLFGLAFYIYWIVARESGVPFSDTRSLRAPGAGSGDGFMELIKQYQPYLSLASSLGGIASFLFQVRVWMRSRAGH
jgi:hypothetical protein